MKHTTTQRAAAIITACTALTAIPAASAATQNATAFTGRVNAICTSNTPAMAAIAKRDPTTRAAVRGYISALLRVHTKQLAQLTGLTPPAAIATKYTRNLGRYANFNRALATMLRHAETGAGEQMAADSLRLQRTSDAFDRVAYAMSYTACVDPNYAPPAGPNIQ